MKVLQESTKHFGNYICHYGRGNIIVLLTFCHLRVLWSVNYQAGFRKLASRTTMFVAPCTFENYVSLFDVVRTGRERPGITWECDGLSQ